jgi:RNA polymerase sigma factor (sigma-70 family)
MKIVEGVSDADLLIEARTSVVAFEAFYRRYVRRVTAFATVRCASAEDTADVVALTFIRLLDALDRYDPDRGDPGPFLMGIAANVGRDLHRRNSRQVAVRARVAGRDLLGPDDIARVEEAIDAEQAAADVRHALDRAPVAEQDVVRLVANGRTPGQAADELGISPGAAWTRLSRARRRLRAQLPLIDEERNR